MRYTHIRLYFCIQFVCTLAPPIGWIPTYLVRHWIARGPANNFVEDTTQLNYHVIEIHAYTLILLHAVCMRTSAAQRWICQWFSSSLDSSWPCQQLCRRYQVFIKQYRKNIYNPNYLIFIRYLRLHPATGGDAADGCYHPLQHAKRAVMPIKEVRNHANKMSIVSKFNNALILSATKKLSSNKMFPNICTKSSGGERIFRVALMCLFLQKFEKLDFPILKN